MDEQGVSRGVNAVEVDFQAPGGAEVMNVAAAPEQFDEHGGFKALAEIVPAAAFVNGDEPGIDGIGLARINHALALRGGEKRGGPDQESVFEIGEKGVETVFGDGQPLGFERVIELLDAEWRGRVSQEMALEPAQRDGIRNAVAFDDVPEHGDIDITLEQRAPVADVELLGIGKTAFVQVDSERFFQAGPGGFGQCGPLG